jgi:hypothetical protein
MTNMKFYLALGLFTKAPSSLTTNQAAVDLQSQYKQQYNNTTTPH